MKRALYFSSVFTLVLVISAFLTGCGPSRQDVKMDSRSAIPPTGKIKVVDVSNKTGRVFDVDAIGLLWQALEESLKKEGILWTEGSPGAPIEMTAQIVEYRKGNLLARYLSPIGGRTTLAVKYEIKEPGKGVTSLESEHSFSFGGGLTLGAWRKVFTVAAEDVVKELRGKLTTPK